MFRKNIKSRILQIFSKFKQHKIRTIYPRISDNKLGITEVGAKNFIDRIMWGNW